MLLFVITSTHLAGTFYTPYCLLYLFLLLSAGYVMVVSVFLIVLHGTAKKAEGRNMQEYLN